MGEFIREYYITDDNLTGRLKSDVFVINGQKEGLYTIYYNTGELLQVYSYVDDKMHGEYKSYYKSQSNSQPYEICTYINDKRHGLYTLYGTDGNIIRTVEYVDGKRHGLYKEYNNGELKEIRNYINDKRT